MAVKLCADCGVRERQYGSYCKPCNNARSKDYQRNNPERRIRRSVKEYGLDLQEVLDYYNQHDGFCDICNCPPEDRDSKGRLCIDHDHETGKFRGLICRKCNLALGNMDDNAAWLRQAAEYLENI